MKLTYIIRNICIAGALLASSYTTASFAADQQAAAQKSFPGDSVYQLPIHLQNQDGQIFPLSDRAGHPMLVSMFYNSCEYVCPMLIDTLQMTEKALSPTEADKLKILLVSFDPARDDVASLKSVVQTRKLDTNRWMLARGEENAIRPLAAALGIQYRQLESGEFNHTTVILLVAPDGRILAKTSQLSQLDQEFLKSVKRVTEDVQK